MVVRTKTAKHREAPQDAARDGRLGEPPDRGRPALRARLAGAEDRARRALRGRTGRFAGKQSGTSRDGRRQSRSSCATTTSASPAIAACGCAPSRRATTRSASRTAASTPRSRPSSAGLWKDSRLHLLRPVRADLPDRRPRRQEGAARRRHAEARSRRPAHHLPLLRRRLLGRHPDQGRQIVGVQPAMDGPANEGALCVKGQFAFDFVQHPDRLKTPFVRVEDGELVRPAGTRRSTAPPRASARSPRASTAAIGLRHRRPAARPTKPPTRSRSSCGRAGVSTTSTTAAVPDTLPPSPVWRPRSDEAPCRTRWPTWRSPTSSSASAPT